MERTRKTLLTTTGILLLAGASSLGHATEKQIAELEADIAELTVKVEEKGGAGDVVATLLANIDSGKKEIAATKESLVETEKRIAGKEILLGIYQSAFRIVTSLTPGQNLGAMVLKTGETVAASSFLNLGNGAILVQTATGSRSIPVADLPDTLASQITRPPTVAPPATTFAALSATKPEFLMSSADRGGKKKTSTVAAASSSTGSSAATPTAEDPQSYEAIRKRNDERMRQISELKLQYSSLYSQKKVARQEKASQEKIFREAKIKRSGTEISSTLKMYDDKINRLETEETELREKISRLQNSME